MITCDQKALQGKVVGVLIFLAIALAGVMNTYAQTPVTQNPCDPRSTANNNTCPTGCTYPVGTGTAPNLTGGVERGCNCFDNLDNDGDGKIDAVDNECAQFFGLSFVGSGESNCSITPPGGNPFVGIGPPKGSDQNTADTQSKVAVGDINGDGVPESVITSKWASTVRVVNADGKTELATYGLSPGDKGDFDAFTDVDGKTCTPNRPLFEHEVLIADIRRGANLFPDKKGEIFAVVSMRGGNPKTPPEGFYLIGLTYVTGQGTLQRMYDPIPLGTNRPGTFGIADMDGDGYAEIYLRDRVYAAETGVLLASEGGKTHLNTSLWDVDVTSAPSAVDVNGDNALELICGPRIYTMPTLTNRTVGTPASLTLYKDMNAVAGFEKYFVKIMNDPAEYGYDTHSSTSVADIDLDGNIDVIMTGAITSGAGRTAVFYWNVAKNTQDYILTHNSTELGYANSGTKEEKERYDNYKDGWIWGTGRINIGDADGNGKPDLSFIAGNQLFCITTNASDKLVTLWTQNSKIVNYGGGITKPLGYREINDSRSGVLTVTIYDFNNDGQPEMVYRDSQSLNVIDGATGVTTKWSVVCQSHTYTEGPIIADVNGDGATDICVTCNTSNSFKIDDDIQQQALGQIRLYFSSGNTWLPTRKVWNQPGYFVANINDDLTLPFPQLKQNLVFSNAPCPNGVPGPQRPLNVFLNQVPFLNANGCPIFPAPDLTFVGDDPELFPNSTNKAVIVTPPICGNLNAIVNVRIGNVGDLPITDLVPVSFFDGDPRLAGSTFLSMTKIQVTNLPTDANFLSADIPVPTSGKVFDLYIALYHDHAIDPMPIGSSGASTKECSIENNVYRVTVVPTPFTAVITKFQDNLKCVVTDPNSGELRTSIFIGPDPVGTFTDYAFQWYFGDGTTNEVPAAQGGKNAIITQLAEGEYTLVVTNTAKGCSALPVKETILLEVSVPPVTITKLSDQTKCDPYDGSLVAQVQGGNTGYTFEWFNSVKNIGINTPEANGLPFETYTVRVSRNGCTNTATESIADFAEEPDATAQVLQDVVSCANLQSGIITGAVSLGGVPIVDISQYTFNWYFYNNVAQSRGSILPAENGSGPTRQDLDFGFYQLEVIRNSTKCLANQSPIVEVKNSTKIPVAFIDETLPQTSCDPAFSNGVFTARVEVDNLPQSVNDYDFEWFSMDGTDPAFVHNTVSGINNSVAEQVKGVITYTVRATNKVSKCFDTEKRVITTDVQVPIITLAKIDNSICDPALGYTGKLTATVEFRGNTNVIDFSDYKFEWDEGTIMAAPFITVADDKSPVLGNLNGGLNPDGTLIVNGGKYYVATVENLSLHCKSLPASEEIKNVVDLPELEMVSTPSTNCIAGKENGSVSLTQVDLLPGPIVKPPDNTYLYQWYKGPLVDPAAIINGATNSSLTGVQGGPSTLATGLIANGEYTVSVTNTVNGCRNEKMFQVGASQVKPDLVLVPKDNDICDITIAPGGKYTGEMAGNPTYTGLYTGPITYSYKWYDGEYTGGAFTLLQRPGSPATSPLIELPAAFYTATVTIEELGCTSDPESEEVEDIANRPEIEGTPAPSTNCIVNKENGSVTLTQVELLPAFKAPDNTYLYQWYKGPDITAPGSIITGATNSNLTGVQGGPSPLATGLIANGEYTVSVINTTNGCRNEKMFQVGASQVKPDLVLVPKDNDICDITIAPGGKYTGEMAGNPTYTGLYTGPITYSYTWYDGEYTGGAFTLLQRPGSPATSPLIELPASFYTATVTIAELGCTSDPESEEVEDIANRPEIEGTPAPSTNCIVNKENGSVTLTQVELLPAFKAPDNTYLYQWYKGPDVTAPGSIIAGATNSNLAGVQGGPSPLATGLIANGEYTVVVINTTNGCRNEKLFQVGASQVKPDLVLVPKDNDICDITIVPGGKYSGEMDANPSYTGLYTGTITYEYKWYSGEYPGGVLGLPEYNSPYPPLGPVPVTTEVLPNLPAAFYTATVTIAELGCTSDPESEEVNDVVNNPEPDGTTLASTNCVAGKENGSATLTQVDLLPTLETPANPNYTYKWYMGPSVDPDPTKIIATTSNLTNRQGGPGALADAISPLLVNGEYTVLVTNITNGCSTPKVFQIADKHVTPAVAMASTPNTICDPTVATSGNYDGTVTATPTITFLPGSAPLAGPAVWSYDWSAGAGPNGSVAIINLTNKGAGYTNATITINGDGAGATAVAIINDLGQITGIEITNAGTNYTNATVGIAGDGAGALATALVHDSGPSNSASATLSNLKGGFYSVTATITELGCTSDLEPIEVDDELWEPIIDVDVTLQTSCTTTPNGALAATVNETTLAGGNGPGQNSAADYTFDWYTDWNANPVDPSGTPWIAPGALVTPQAPNGTISVLPGNKYYAVFTTRKATGCVASRKPFLGEDIKIPVLSLTKNSDFTSCIPPDGSITANVDIPPASPTQTYQFYWLREQPNDITTDSDDVIAAVTTNTFPNRLITGGVGSQTDNFGGLIYGDYTVVVKDNYTNCISLPTSMNLEDKTRANITLSGTPIPSSCGLNDGTLNISAVRNDAVISDFDFELYKGTPTNATLPIVFSYLGVDVNDPEFDATLQTQDGGYPKLANTALPGVPNATIPGLGSFIYTVIATDDFGCKNYKTYFLPFLDAHSITTNFVNSSICPDPFDPGNILTGNGSIAVSISQGPPSMPELNQTQFSYAFYKGGVPGTGLLASTKILNVPQANPYLFPSSPVDCVAFPGDPSCNFDQVSTTLDLAPGSYIVEVKELVTAGQCPVYESIEIKQAVLPPMLNLAGTLKANDACDIVASANGEATVEINLNAADESLTFGPVSYDISAFDPALHQSFSDVDDGDPDADPTTLLPVQQLISNLKPSRVVDPYTIRVATKINGVLNGCVSEMEIAIPDKPTIAELVSGDLTIVDAEYCTPTLERSAKVIIKDVRLNNGNLESDISDYEFKWATNAAVTSVVYTANGINGIANTGGDEFINDLPGGTGTVAPGTVTIGSYWVRLEKKADNSGSGGIGCFSAPFEVVIGDKTVDPIATLTPFSNTACDGNFEGEMKIEASTASLGLAAPYTNPGFGAGPGTVNYTYLGLTAPAPALLLNGTGNGDGLIAPVVDNDIFQNRSDGSYSVRITNDVTGCFVEKTRSIDKISPPVFTLTTAVNDQNLCFPSGKVEVLDTFIDGLSDGGTGNFVFRWYNVNPGPTINPLIDGNPLVDGANAVISADLLDNINRPNIGAGDFFVKAIRNTFPGSGCASALVQVTIEDVSEDPDVTLTPLSNTSCDPAVYEGSMQVLITEEPNTRDGIANPGVGKQYVYDWTSATATPPADIGDLTLTLGKYTGTGLAIPPDYTQLEDGLYTLKVYNNETGCFATDTREIIKNEIPVIVTKADVTHQNLCFPSGTSTVTEVKIVENGVAAVKPFGEFTYEWATDANMTSIIGDATRFLTVTNFPTIAAGSYYVRAKRGAFTPGSGCISPAVKVIIDDVSEDPKVALTPLSNTSCDPAVYEGSMKVVITEEPLTGDSNPNPGVGKQYVYDWTSATATPLADIGDLTLTGGKYTGTGLAIPPDYTQLEHGLYTLKVYNNETGCFDTDTREILKNEIPVIITKADVTHQNLCFPSGTSTVTEVKIVENGVASVKPFGEFTYEWATDADMTSIIGDATRFLTVANFPAIAAGSYFVRAKRGTFTPGAGCISPAVKVIIDDVSEDPNVRLTPFANTACDDANVIFEGSIQVAITEEPVTRDGIANPGVGQQYVFDWTTATSTPITDSNGLPLPPTGPYAGDGVANPPINTFVQLQDGFYTLLAYNNLTGCSDTDTKEIIKNETPVILTKAITTPQNICFPSGTSTVTEVQIIQNGTATTKPLGEFTYEWSTDVTMTSIIGDATTDLNVGNYPTIGAGSYFVRARRNSGAAFAPGSGCVSPVVKVIIGEDTKDPKTQFGFTPNSSCNNDNPNAEIEATALERDNITIDTYTFEWKLNDVLLPIPAPQPGSTITETLVANVSTLTDAPEGKYTVNVFNTVTGCEFLSGIDVNIDLTISLPNIITVDKIEPTTCIGDGTAQVTSISVGGGPALTTGSIEPPAFEYEWYETTFDPASLLAEITPVLSNIKTGKYYVLVKDLTTDCKSLPTEVVLVDQNIILPSIEITLTSPQISCDQTVFGTGVLEAVITADNSDPLYANPDYSFEWFPNLNITAPNIASTPAGPSNVNVISDLKSGNYSLQVINSKTGCANDAIYIVPDNAPQFLPQLITSSFERTLCVGQDGSVFASIVNIRDDYPFINSLDYTADLFFGDKVNDPTLPSLTPDVADLANVTGFPQNFTTLSNLAEGKYTVRVKDNNTGCVSVMMEEVIDGRKYPEITVVAESPNIICDDANANGQLFATADGNRVAGYTFDWYTGATIAPAATPIVINNSRLMGQVAGDYSVRVTKELTGCQNDKNGKIADGRIFPPAPTALVVSDNTNCITPDNPIPNGWVTAHVGCNTIDYIFNWYNGTTTTSTSDFVGANYFERNKGSYTVTATDIVTKCLSLPATVTVADISVLPQVVLTSTPEECRRINGTISLEHTNFSSVTENVELCGEQFIIDKTTALTGIEWRDGSNNSIGTGIEIFGLEAGFYSVDFVTNAGCKGTAIGEVGTEILSYNLVSVNGDGANDVWIVDCLEKFPNNNVKIFNRSGIKVYEANYYDNAETVFRGIGEEGIYALGDKLPDGTYFYIIDKGDGSKPKTGYLELVR